MLDDRDKKEYGPTELVVEATADLNQCIEDAEDYLILHSFFETEALAHEEAIRQSLADLRESWIESYRFLGENTMPHDRVIVATDLQTTLRTLVALNKREKDEANS
jgi:hypothetical protein